MFARLNGAGLQVIGVADAVDDFLQVGAWGGMRGRDRPKRITRAHRNADVSLGGRSVEPRA